MTNEYRFTKPPQPLRRTRMDNLMLVPGSALPQIARCQEIANQLPGGGVLIVLSAHNPKQQQALLAVAKLLSEEGHQVRVIHEAEVSQGAALAEPRLLLDI